MVLIALVWFSHRDGSRVRWRPTPPTSASCVSSRASGRCPGGHRRCSGGGVRAARQEEPVRGRGLLWRTLGAAMAPLSLLLLGPLGWRGLFWIGAPPGDPASAGTHPAARVPAVAGREGPEADAEDVARKVGIPLPAPAVGSAAAASRDSGSVTLRCFREYILPTLLLGFMSFSACCSPMG